MKCHNLKKISKQRCGYLDAKTFGDICHCLVTALVSFINTFLLNFFITFTSEERHLYTCMKIFINEELKTIIIFNCKIWKNLRTFYFFSVFFRIQYYSFVLCFRNWRYSLHIYGENCQAEKSMFLVINYSKKQYELNTIYDKRGYFRYIGKYKTSILSKEMMTL